MEVSGFGIFAIAIVIFVVATLLMGVRQVPQGFAYTVERFGKYYTTLHPGLGLIVPWVDSIGRRVNMMEQLLDVPTQQIITRDNASVAVDGVLFYQVLDAARASYEVDHLQNALLNLVTTNIRTVMGSMDLDQLLSQRDEINLRLLAVIDAAAGPWGVKTNRVEIKDIVPPRDIADSMGRQMKAERERRAAILEAEGDRAAEILRAEGKKQALMLDAEGRKEAAFRDAEARERQAEAEANATRILSEAIVSGQTSAVNYFIAEKYVRAIHALAQSPNQKTFIVPMEMGGLVGTLAGVAEVARAAFQDPPSPRPDTPSPRPSGPGVPRTTAS
jgi:regulator of protease activity HflC (stomatin/prohibitin superfamily)